ncbi:threonine/serine exporter family protein [Blastococcus sp. SYSU DS0541]
MGAAEGAISGFPLTAAARALDVLTSTTGIVVGVAGVQHHGHRAQVPLSALDPSTFTVPFAVASAAAAGMVGVWAVASHARPLAVGVATVAGALAWTTSSTAAALSAGPAVASATAAVVVGSCGEALSDRLRIPPLLVAVCGIVPLLPGLAIYRGLFAVVVGAATIGLASPPASCWAGTSAGRWAAEPGLVSLDRGSGVRRPDRRGPSIDRTACSDRGGISAG